MAQHHIVGASLAVVNNNRIVFQQAYGYRDKANKKPVTNSTRFQAASISKVLTALATIQTAQEKSFSLDDDVNQHLRSWKVPINDCNRKDKIRLRDILSHRSGLSNYRFQGYGQSEKTASLTQILNGTAHAINHGT